MSRRIQRVTIALALMALMVFPSGCWWKNGGTDETPSPSQSTTPTPGGTTDTTTPPAATTTVVVYLINAAEKVVPVSRTVAPPTVANAAVKELIAGPTAAEKAAGLRTLVPEGTELLGVTIQDRTATVDLSSTYGSGGGSLSMMARVAQMVFTLTQFSTVDNVKFKMNGTPVTVLGGEGIMLSDPQTRAKWEDFAPAVLIESPTLGTAVTSPLRVYGSANVFEALFHIDVVDGSGKTIATERVMATSGTGTRGTFDVTIKWTSATAGSGKIIAWYEAPKDGSRVEAFVVPVKF